MEFYYKLVRDNIPEIMAKQGKSVSFCALQGDKLKQALKDKLVEEVNELINAETREDIIEEMADVIDVLCAIKAFHNIEDEEGYKREEKNKEKGGFAKGYFLEYVSE